MSREPRDQWYNKSSRAELTGLIEAHNNRARRVTHRSVLTLHTGAVEAQGRYPLLDALDVQDALISSLSRLRLWEVLRLQSNGLDHLYWNQDLVHSQQLGAVLGTEGMAQLQHVGHQKNSDLCKYYTDVDLSYSWFPRWPSAHIGEGVGMKKSQVLVSSS